MSTIAEMRDGVTPLIVGGSVRDALEGSDVKDYDIEVYGLTISALAHGLRSRGYAVNAVGQQYGVLKVRAGKHEVDLSVPRRDSLVGVGHRGFEVEVDEGMSVVEASSRRDFTFNAMMYDHALGVCIDPHDGQTAMRERVLRHVSDAFAEDPLRVLRGFQFAGRFDMTLDPETALMCQGLRPQYKELATERVQEEWGKFYRKAVKPSAALRALRDAGWHDTVPGFQDIDFQAADKAACTGPERLGGVLCRNMSDRDAETFLETTILGSRTARSAYALSRAQAPAGASRATMRQWARGLGKQGLTIEDWATREAAFDADTGNVVRAAQEHGVFSSPPVNALDGNAVLSRANRTGGPWVGALLAQAQDAQDQGLFDDEAGALLWLDRQKIN